MRVVRVVCDAGHSPSAYALRGSAIMTVTIVFYRKCNGKVQKNRATRLKDMAQRSKRPLSVTAHLWCDQDSTVEAQGAPLGVSGESLKTRSFATADVIDPFARTNEPVRGQSSDARAMLRGPDDYPRGRRKSLLTAHDKYFFRGHARRIRDATRAARATRE